MFLHFSQADRRPLRGAEQIQRVCGPGEFPERYTNADHSLAFHCRRL